eukprot:1890240-Pyramimonas_sp.AAC.1
MSWASGPPRDSTSRKNCKTRTNHGRSSRPYLSEPVFEPDRYVRVPGPGSKKFRCPGPVDTSGTPDPGQFSVPLPLAL